MTLEYNDEYCEGCENAAEPKSNRETNESDVDNNKTTKKVEDPLFEPSSGRRIRREIRIGTGETAMGMITAAATAVEGKRRGEKR